MNTRKKALAVPMAAGALAIAVLAPRAASASAEGELDPSPDREDQIEGRVAKWLYNRHKARHKARRHLLVLAAGVLAGALIGSTSPAEGSVPLSATAYVTNRGDNTVSPVSVPTNSVGSPIPVGALPYGVAVTPDATTVYVANWGGNTVTPIATATNVAGSPITVGSNPIGVAVTPNGQTVYVANNGSTTVTPINVATNTAGSPIIVGADPFGVAITPNGTTAYVTTDGTRTVTPINVATNTAGSPINVGGQPAGIAITPDGSTAYVAIPADNKVIPINLATNTAGSAISVGGTLTPPFGGGPTFIAITPDGKTAYVSIYYDNSVTPIDLATNTTGTPISVGSNPAGLAVTPNGKTLYVANSGTNTVTPIEVATNAAGAPITVGNNPFGIAITLNLSRPTTVALSPPDAVNTVGTSHTVTATVQNAAGNPVQGSTVLFDVQGSVTTSGSCTTDANGQCSFTYQGPQLPGADVITGCADSNGNGSVDAGEPCGTATKAWTLPTTTSGQTAGGGQVANAAQNDQVAFGFTAKSSSSGVKGECSVVDPSTNTKVKCLDATTLVQTATHATFFGNATVNGVATSYRIDVDDLAEPGDGRDTFKIQTASGYTVGGVLIRGNIQVHN
jgi:YVTN family beta-propeller protein